MALLWSSLRQKIKPSSSFREELRAQIYEASTEKEKSAFCKVLEKIELPIPQLVLRIEKKYPLLERVKRSVTGFITDFKRGLLVLGGGVLAMLLVVPIFSLFSVPISEASQSSFLRHVSGNIEIKRGGQTLLGKNNNEVFIGDSVISAEDTSAEIIFFEGTVLRFDTNTEIRIIQMRPNPLLFASGGIKIELQKGRIWVKTFQSPHSSSRFQIITPNSSLLLNRASLDVRYEDGQEQIRVFENEVIIDVQGVSVGGIVSLSQKEGIIFTPFDEDLPVATPLFSESRWIIKNKNADALYKKEYLSTVSKKIKEKYFKDELSGKIHTFFDEDPTPEEVEAIIIQMNQFLLLTSHKPLLEISPSPEPSHTALLKENNNNTQVAIRTTLKKNTYQPRYIALENTLKEGVVGEEEERVVSPSNTLIIENKQGDVSAADIEIFKTAREVLQENKKVRYEKAAQNFSDQINAYSFENSRTVQSQNILKKIPDSVASIELLEVMEKSAPKDVKKYIKRKRIAIIKAEKEKVESAFLKKSATEKKEKQRKNFLQQQKIQNQQNNKDLNKEEENNLEEGEEMFFFPKEVRPDTIGLPEKRKG